MRSLRRLLAGGAAVAAVGLHPLAARACFTDDDCPDNAYCVILFGEVEGLCEHGHLEGEPVRRKVDPRHKNTTEGKRCLYDSDCDPGMACEPQAGKQTKICVR